MTSTLQIGPCPADYRQWLVTMYSQFGGKWSNLHLGPMWRVSRVSQENVAEPKTSFNLLEVSAYILL